MLLTILIAALSVCGLFMVVWTILEALFMQIPKESYHVFCLHGSDAQVEQQVRSCRWLRERRGLRGRLILVDCGISPEAQITVQLMLRNDETIQLCTSSQLADYIRWENETIGAGTH